VAADGEYASPVFVVYPPVARTDLPGLCQRLADLIAACEAEVIACDLTALGVLDAVTIDLVARLDLTAIRLGRRIRLTQPDPRLSGLLRLFGLDGVIGTPGRSGLGNTPSDDVV
jgi:ABC-type transporter Mla MlaB component